MLMGPLQCMLEYKQDDLIGNVVIHEIRLFTKQIPFELLHNS